MPTPTEIVDSFYNKLKAGDAAGALGLMAPDIEWITMWHYKVDGRGPERVAEGLFKPLMADSAISGLNSPRRRAQARGHRPCSATS